MTIKKDEALKLALEAAANYIDALGGDSRKYRQALAEQPTPVAEPHEKSAEIPQSITCPFCESQHVPGWLHDYNMDRMKKPAQRKPLTNEQIQYAFRTNSVVIDNGNAYMVAGKRAINIARAIEAAHGIGNKNDK